jgi:hypothetical protein
MCCGWKALNGRAETLPSWPKKERGEPAWRRWIRISKVIRKSFASEVKDLFCELITEHLNENFKIVSWHTKRIIFNSCQNLAFGIQGSYFGGGSSSSPNSCCLEATSPLWLRAVVGLTAPYPRHRYFLLTTSQVWIFSKMSFVSEGGRSKTGYSSAWCHPPYAIHSASCSRHNLPFTLVLLYEMVR